MPRETSEASLEALRKHGAKPGEVRNPTGRNGWSAMRERYRELLDGDLDDLVRELIRIGKHGEDDKVRVQAMSKALGPIVNVTRTEVTGADGAPLNFADIAKKAASEDE